MAARIESGEVVDLAAPAQATRARATLPATEYEIDRQIRQADELHRDLVAFRAGANYPAALRAARAKSERGQATRSGRRAGGYGDAVR